VAHILAANRQFASRSFDRAGADLVDRHVDVPCGQRGALELSRLCDAVLSALILLVGVPSFIDPVLSSTSATRRRVLP